MGCGYTRCEQGASPFRHVGLEVGRAQSAPIYCLEGIYIYIHRMESEIVRELVGERDGERESESW